MGNSLSNYLSICKLIKATKNHTFHEFEVSEEDLNFVFSLHGGCTTTILEFCMKNSIPAFESGNPPKQLITVDLCISFLSAATLGDILLIETEKIKEGGSLTFISGKIFRKFENLPIALGKQTLALALNSEIKFENVEECKIPFNSSLNFLKKFHEFYNSFSLDGVNYIFDRCKPISATLGHIFFEFTVAKEDLNLENKLHSGCLATLLDVLMSLSIFKGDDFGQLGVTADLNLTYLENLVIDEKLLIECTVIKHGSRMAFINVKAWKIKGGKNVIVAIANQALTVFKGFLSSSKL